MEQPARTLDLVDELRAVSAVAGRLEAKRLRLVAELAVRVEAEARAELAGTPRVPGAPSDTEVITSAIEVEISVALGISRGQAQHLVELARRLVSVLPATLAALADGRLDARRAEALAEETALLDDDTTRRVEAELLADAGQAPWDGPSPRTWKARVQRAVVRADADAARRRRQRAVRARRVTSWPVGDGTGVLQAHAAAEDIALADQVISDLAHAWAGTGPDGEKLSMDERRADALIDLFRRVRDGADLPAGPVRREREVGLVLHADTFFGDGPAAGAPGQVRGLGTTGIVDPVTAAETARAEIARGASVSVLLTGADGVLQRLVHLPAAPAEGWARDALVAAVREALPTLPPLSTGGYPPTTAIAEHVRAAHPRCTGYDCPRAARRCDLDHDRPWPRGPTSVTNLQPRCRREHEHKTRGLIHTELRPDGSVRTTTLTGTTVTTRPEPLPGHAPGEGYAPAGPRLRAHPPAA